MIDHPAAEQAERVFQTLCRSYLYLSARQLRNCVIVELTYAGMEEIISKNVAYATNYSYKEGPLVISGIKYYHVDKLADGDTWRVINCLGTN